MKMLRILVSAALLAAAAARAEAQKATKESNAALHRWTDAVMAHAPGEPDAAVQYVAGLKYSDCAELYPAFELFIQVHREALVTTRSPLEQNITAFARTIRLDPGTAIFLERAAILHADALVFAGRFPAPPDDAPVPPPQQTRSDVPGGLTPVKPTAPPPLLYNEWTTLTRDGEVIGNVKADWNLPFARALLDVLLLPLTRMPEATECPPNLPVSCTPVAVADRRVLPQDRAFVAQWYHAVSAYLFARGKYADAKTHLEQAARVLPDDPHALFDRGSYAETFGLPIYQAVRGDPGAGRTRVAAPGLPTESKTNAEAERMYRRVLEIDPAYIEARIRLARLLERRGQIDEAASAIAAAIEANPAGVPRYYAHIVAGRIAAARRRYEEALQHYRAASALYANAQSALLGASHAAMMLSNVPQTLESLQGLDGSVSAATADPWWDYELGAGRDAAALLRSIWAAVK